MSDLVPAKIAYTSVEEAKVTHTSVEDRLTSSLSESMDSPKDGLARFEEDLEDNLSRLEERTLKGELSDLVKDRPKDSPSNSVEDRLKDSLSNVEEGGLKDSPDQVEDKIKDSISDLVEGSSSAFAEHRLEDSPSSSVGSRLKDCHSNVEEGGLKDSPSYLVDDRLKDSPNLVEDKSKDSLSRLVEDNPSDLMAEKIKNSSLVEERLEASPSNLVESSLTLTLSDDQTASINMDVAKPNQSHEKTDDRLGILCKTDSNITKSSSFDAEEPIVDMSSTVTQRQKDILVDRTEDNCFKVQSNDISANQSDHLELVLTNNMRSEGTSQSSNYNLLSHTDIQTSPSRNADGSFQASNEQYNNALPLSDTATASVPAESSSDVKLSNDDLAVVSARQCEVPERVEASHSFFDEDSFQNLVSGLEPVSTSVADSTLSDSSSQDVLTSNDKYNMAYQTSETLPDGITETARLFKDSNTDISRLGVDEPNSSAVKTSPCVISPGSQSLVESSPVKQNSANTVTSEVDGSTTQYNSTRLTSPSTKGSFHSVHNVDTVSSCETSFLNVISDKVPTADTKMQTLNNCNDLIPSNSESSEGRFLSPHENDIDSSVAKADEKNNGDAQEAYTRSITSTHGEASQQTTNDTVLSEAVPGNSKVKGTFDNDNPVTDSLSNASETVSDLQTTATKPITNTQPGIFSGECKPTSPDTKTADQLTSFANTIISDTSASAPHKVHINSDESFSDSSPPIIARRKFEKVYRPRSSRSLSTTIAQDLDSLYSPAVTSTFQNSDTKSIVSDDVSSHQSTKDNISNELPRTNGSLDGSLTFTNSISQCEQTLSNDKPEDNGKSPAVKKIKDARSMKIGESESAEESEDWLAESGHSFSNGPVRFMNWLMMYDITNAESLCISLLLPVLTSIMRYIVCLVYAWSMFHVGDC